MNHLRDKNRLHRMERIAVVSALSSLAVTGCSVGSVAVEGNKPAIILDESERTRYKTAQETGGYPHSETTYWMTVEQCDRDDLEFVDEDGCVVLKTRVSEKTAENFEPNDTIVFKKDRTGYPVE